MATDYKFGFRCWQDQAGDENAKVNIFIDGTQVGTEIEITATSADSPQVITVEKTGMADPSADGTTTVEVKLANDYYVDASTDRNAYIDELYIICKISSDPGYVYRPDGPGTAKVVLSAADTTPLLFNGVCKPSSITGDELPEGWYDGSTLQIIPINGAAGVSMVLPLTKENMWLNAEADSNRYYT
jgi:hypothetical protein